MDQVWRELQAVWEGGLAERIGDLFLQTIFALLALLVVLFLARISLGAARRALRRARAHANASVLVDRLIQFGFILLATSWLLSIYGVELTAVVAIFGATALAISLAMQDVLKNLVAGLYILIERPFKIGDQIDFRAFTGTVEAIELRTTALRTASGQRVIIPNAMLFADALVNRSAYGRQLLRLRVVVAGDEARRDAIDAIAGAVESATRELDAPERTFSVESVTGEKLTIRVEIAAPDARSAASDIAWAVRDRLTRAEVTVIE